MQALMQAPMTWQASSNRPTSQMSQRLERREGAAGARRRNGRRRQERWRSTTRPCGRRINLLLGGTCPQDNYERWAWGDWPSWTRGRWIGHTTRTSRTPTSSIRGASRVPMEGAIDKNLPSLGCTSLLTRALSTQTSQASGQR